MNFDEIAKEYGYNPEPAVSEKDTSAASFDDIAKEYGYNPNGQATATQPVATTPERPYDAVSNRYEGETDEEGAARTQGSNRALAKSLVRGVEGVAMNTLALPVQAVNSIASYAGFGDDVGRPLLNTMTGIEKADQREYNRDADVTANPGISTAGGIIGSGIGMAPQMVAQGLIAPARAVAGLGMLSRAGAAAQNVGSNALQNIALGFAAGGDGDYSKGIIEGRGGDAAMAGTYSVLGDMIFGAAGKVMRAGRGPSPGLLNQVSQETDAVPGAMQRSVDDVAAAERVGVTPNILDVSDSPTLQNTATQMDAATQTKLMVDRQKAEAAITKGQLEQVDFMVPEGREVAQQQADALYTKTKPMPVPKEVQSKIFQSAGTPEDDEITRLIYNSQGGVSKVFQDKKQISDRIKSFANPEEAMFTQGVDDVALDSLQQQFNVNKRTISKLASNKPITGPDGKTLLPLEQRTAELSQLNSQQDQIQAQINKLNNKVRPDELARMDSERYLELGEVHEPGTVGFYNAMVQDLNHAIKSTIAKPNQTSVKNLTDAKNKLLAQMDDAFPEYALARKTVSRVKLNEWATEKLAKKKELAGNTELTFSQQNQALWGDTASINTWKDHIRDMVPDLTKQKETLQHFEDIIRTTRVLEKSPLVKRLNQQIDDSFGNKIRRQLSGATAGAVLGAGSSLVNSGDSGSPILAGIVGATGGMLLNGRYNKQMLKLLSDPKYIAIIQKGAMQSNKIDTVTKIQALAKAFMTAKTVYEKEHGPMEQEQEGAPNANQNNPLPEQVQGNIPPQP